MVFSYIINSRKNKIQHTSSPRNLTSQSESPIRVTRLVFRFLPKYSSIGNHQETEATRYRLSWAQALRALFLIIKCPNPVSSSSSLIIIFCGESFKKILILANIQFIGGLAEIKPANVFQCFCQKHILILDLFCVIFIKWFFNKTF